MHLIEHPEQFKTGARVLMLKGRHKDGVEKERTIVRVSHGVDQFDGALGTLVSALRPGERIYASAGERSMPAAIREFKRRQLDADYDDDPQRFYRALNERWVASLMQPASQLEKLWLFDCDTPEDLARVEAELAASYEREPPYKYATKSGAHIVLQPFDKSKLSDASRALIHTNPILLWAWRNWADAANADLCKPLEEDGASA